MEISLVKDRPTQCETAPKRILMFPRRVERAFRQINLKEQWKKKIFFFSRYSKGVLSKSKIPSIYGLELKAGFSAKQCPDI